MLTAIEKRSLLRATAEERGLRVFVETGTYDGETVAAMRAAPPACDLAYSIELSQALAAKAFSRHQLDRGVYIWQGSSAYWLKVFLKGGMTLSEQIAGGVDSTRVDAPLIATPALFWLDAHAGEAGTAGAYGECPLREELRIILQHATVQKCPHVILIDDVRLMGHGQWPTLEEVTEMATAAGYEVSVEDDVARLVPR